MNSESVWLQDSSFNSYIGYIEKKRNVKRFSLPWYNPWGPDKMLIIIGSPCGYHFTLYRVPTTFSLSVIHIFSYNIFSFFKFS